ncbi:hypothetical protein MTO96_039457 [Rhipicephalus appendiculatus]
MLGDMPETLTFETTWRCLHVVFQLMSGEAKVDLLWAFRIGSECAHHRASTPGFPFGGRGLDPTDDSSCVVYSLRFQVGQLMFVARCPYFWEVMAALSLTLVSVLPAPFDAAGCPAPVGLRYGRYLFESSDVLISSEP